MTEYARDTFTRTVSSGLGSAEVGGPWGEDRPSGWTTRVTGSMAATSVTAGSGGACDARLGSGLNGVAMHGHMRFRDLGESSGSSVGRLVLRSIGTANVMGGYAFSVGRTQGNVLIAEVRLLVDDALGSTLITRTSLPAVTPGDWWHVEGELIGASPTTVRARWWREADGAPADDTGWQQVTDATGPQGAGAVGIRQTRAPGASGTPAIELRIDGLFAADPMVPSFVAVPDAVDGLTVRFDPATSTGDPVGWLWDFGDGTPVSTERTPTHTYAVPGTYSVTLTLTTRWTTVRSITTAVPVTGEPLEPPPVRPDVFLNGENVCDRIYALSWRTGRDRWPEDVTGHALTMNLRGRFPDVVMGSKVVVQLPAGAPDGTVQLWVGEVDTVNENVQPVEAETTTTIVAQDVLAYLSRWHIVPDTTIDEQGLPGRLNDLKPRAGITYRAKWAGVPGSRWPTLKAMSSTADNLRQYTYLELLKRALRASIAGAHYARDGVVVYAPLDPPAGLTPPVLDLDATGPDCPSVIDRAKSTPDGMVNRWTAGTGFDRLDRSSMEAYGEREWMVESGVLKADSTFPLNDVMAAAMRDPFPGAKVTIPVRQWAARSYLAEPLDMASLQGELFGILGVSHTVDLDVWTVELSLDRDPWTLTGTTPPVTPPTVKQRTQTFSITKDALLASPNMGAGASTRNAVGLWSGTKFRMLLQPNLDYTNKPTKIVSAKLRLWTAGQDMCAYGSTPQVHVDRVTGSWNEGSSGGHGPPWTFNTSNAVVYPGPSCTTSGRRSANVPSTEQTLLELDVTAIVQSWANGASNRGFRIISQNEGSTSRTTEFHTAESPTTGRRPELVVTYQYSV